MMFLRIFTTVLDMLLVFLLVISSKIENKNQAVSLIIFVFALMMSSGLMWL